MKVVVKQSYGHMDRGAVDMTYQSPFRKKVECEQCGKTARLMMLVQDDEGFISQQRRPKGARVWPHDSLAVANYLCTTCGAMTTDWNQG